MVKKTWVCANSPNWEMTAEFSPISGFWAPAASWGCRKGDFAHLPRASLKSVLPSSEWPVRPLAFSSPFSSLVESGPVKQTERL